MAGAEKLIEKILGEAQSDAERIWREAEDKKKLMHEEMQRDIDRQKAQIEKDAEDAIAEKKRRLAAVYDLENRKQLLAAKQEMMAKAKSLALEKLLAISDAEYVTLMKKKLIICAASGEGSIAVSENEKRLGDAFLADVNSELKRKAGRGEITFADSRDISGGFVYISAGMEINMSLESLLSESWQEAETEVAALLFDQK